MDTLASSGTDLNRVTKAARNNALWCDAVCRAHGTPGAWHQPVDAARQKHSRNLPRFRECFCTWQDALWFNRHAVPRFYPNAVTLRPNQAQALGAVLNQLPAHCAVKDSLFGYERGDDLVMAQSAGFEPTGLLRVWAR